MSFMQGKKGGLCRSVGRGPVKILVLVDHEDLDQWLRFFEEKITVFNNLEVLVAEKVGRNFIQNLFKEHIAEPFIFVLDLSEKGNNISGYGSRYRQIAQRAVGRDLEINKMNEDYARWFSANTEFSSIKVGVDRPDLIDFVSGVLSYFNGTQ